MLCLSSTAFTAAAIVTAILGIFRVKGGSYSGRRSESEWEASQADRLNVVIMLN
jgi:hypothetical protein